jgi:hypothetical protein
MAEIYAPERAAGMDAVPKRDERGVTQPAKRGNKTAVIITVVAVAGFLALVAFLIF